MKNKLGVDTIIILVAIIIVAVLLIVVLTNKGEEIEGVEGAATSGLSQAIQQANDAELLKFNAKIDGFKGTQSGQFLKALFKYVDESNQKNPDKQIVVTGLNTAEQLEDGKTYNVSMSKDSSGYYNKVNIEEKK